MSLSRKAFRLICYTLFLDLHFEMKISSLMKKFLQKFPQHRNENVENDGGDFYEVLSIKSELTLSSQLSLYLTVFIVLSGGLKD